MPFSRFPLLLAGCLAAVTAAAQTQPLMCPAPPAGRSCDAFHYHVAMYRPDNKTWAEISAGPQFATQAACENARAQQTAANAKVVDFFRNVKEQQYPADRIGPCHCDMTTDRSSLTYLAEPQRTIQLRNAEEIRLRVRERLLDNKVASDSEIVHALYLDPPSTPALAMNKITPLPRSARVAVVTSPDDLRPTRTLDTAKPVVAAIDIPLVEIGGGARPTPPEIPVAASTSLSTGSAATAPQEAATAPQEEVEPETRVEAEPVTQPQETEPDEEEETEESAEETAERFVSYENQRIQNVLRASSAVTDEAVKVRIYDATQERIQLLSNLRQLIEGSGTRGRLTAAARDAQTEADRLALMAKLFGQGIQRHWAPRDASDVAFDVDPAIADAPERALRDKSGRFTQEQRKRALYLVLARTQPTEDQRLWLSTVVEEFLK